MTIKCSRQSHELISSRIRIIRGQMNQEEFSKLFNLTRKQVSTMERGEVAVPVSLCVAIHKKLDISFKWLLLGEGPMYVSEEEKNVCIVSHHLTDDEREFIDIVRRVPSLMRLVRLIESSNFFKKYFLEFAHMLEDMNGYLINSISMNQSMPMHTQPISFGGQAVINVNDNA